CGSSVCCGFGGRIFSSSLPEASSRAIHERFNPTGGPGAAMPTTSSSGTSEVSVLRHELGRLEERARGWEWDTGLSLQVDALLIRLVCLPSSIRRRAPASSLRRTRRATARRRDPVCWLSLGWGPCGD